MDATQLISATQPTNAFSLQMWHYLTGSKHAFQQCKIYWQEGLLQQRNNWPNTFLCSLSYGAYSKGCRNHRFAGIDWYFVTTLWCEPNSAFTSTLCYITPLHLTPLQDSQRIKVKEPGDKQKKRTKVHLFLMFLFK